MVTQEQLDNILREPERWKAIERNPLETDDLRFVSGAGKKKKKIVLSDTQVPEKRIRKLVILDTETTGITADAELIELAFCVCSYDVRTKEVLSIDCLFDAFSKPEKELSEEIQQLTGIRPDMLKKRLMWEDFAEYLPERCLVVAHNASFDRRIFEKTFNRPESWDLHWADSLTEIRWTEKGYKAKNLEMLAYLCGYWYQAHRAINDVLMLLQVLKATQTLRELCEAAAQVSLEIEVKCSFDDKEQIKAAGFRWRSEGKSWVKVYRAMADWERERQVLPRSVKVVGSQVFNSQTRFKN